MSEASRSAFIVANDEYADQRLRRLRAPAADARELAGVLEAPDVGGFDVDLSINEPEHVVRRRLSEFFENRGIDDLLLLHLSCHGVKDEDGRLYFATPDTQMDHLEATAIPAEFVNRQMTRSRSRRVVLLLDCCYSGAFARGWVSRAGDRVDIQERFDGRGRIVLTASSAMEYSFEGDQLSGEGSPSVFTSALVQGLATGEADRNRDGYISVDELYDFAFEQVRAATPSQTPGKWVFDVQGDFFVARSRLEPVSPPGLPTELVAATMSPFAHIRLGAAEELKALLDHPDELMASQAREHLTALVEDDSQRVSHAAAEALAPDEPVAEPASEPTPEPAAAPAAPAEPVGVPDTSSAVPHSTAPEAFAVPHFAAVPKPAPRPASDEPLPPERVTWMGRAAALALLAILPQSLVTFGNNTPTGWNAFAVLSPIEGALAALAVWLLVAALQSGRVPTSVGAGALLVFGASCTASAVGLVFFSAEWVSLSAVLFALAVLAGAVLTIAAGVDCLRTALPTAGAGRVTPEALVLGGAGVVAGFVALFVKYDGESSLVDELEGLGEYFFSAAFACLLALVGLLTLRGWPRFAAGALVASGLGLAVHYLGIVLASANAIGEPGETRAGGFTGILGGLLVATAGIYTYAASRPSSTTEA
jgi:Caspase domain